jgi:phosphatidylinositol glycan class W
MRARGWRLGKGASWLLQPLVLPPLMRWLLSWVCVDIVLWVSLTVIEALVEPISRRSCNAAYIVWILALGLSLVLPLAVAQISWQLQGNCTRSQVEGLQLQPWLPSAANRSMLVVFLISNVLTGLINMLIDTIALEDGISRVLVSVYTVGVAAVAAFLDSRFLI